MVFTKIGNRIIFAECYDSSTGHTPHITITRGDLINLSSQGGDVEDASRPADN